MKRKLILSKRVDAQQNIQQGNIFSNHNEVLKVYNWYKFGPNYDKQGQLIRRSVVGEIETFRKLRSQGIKQKLTQQKLLSQDQLIEEMKKVKFNLNKEVNKNNEQFRALQQYEKMKNVWEQQIKKTKRSKSESIMERQKGCSFDDKSGRANDQWYLQLRQQPEDKTRRNIFSNFQTTVPLKRSERWMSKQQMQIEGESKFEREYRDKVIEDYKQSGYYQGNGITLGFEGLIGEYISTTLSIMISTTILYFVISTIFYLFFFHLAKRVFLPKYKGDLMIMQDILLSLWNIGGFSFVVSIWAMIQPRYSQMYYDINDYSYGYYIMSIFLHMMVDETGLYWIHRWVHTYPNLYAKYHKYHHISIDVTPYSSLAFHPFDSILQGLPANFSCFLFPLHYSILATFNLMTLIWICTNHDNVCILPCKLFLYAPHHTIHHEKTGGQKNMGKFTSIWDRIMKTYEDGDRVQYGFDNKAKPLFDGINKMLERI